MQLPHCARDARLCGNWVERRAGWSGHDGSMVVWAEDAAVGRLRVAVGRLAVLTQARVRTGRSHDDADDAMGTVDTDDAHGFDPLPLLQALHEHGARVAVIGQVAGIMHGSQELTGTWTCSGTGPANRHRRSRRPSDR